MYERNYHIQRGVTINSITYIGMDVHTTNYTLCAFALEGQKIFAETRINPDVKELIKYHETLNKRQDGKAQFVCGYVAGRAVQLSLDPHRPSMLQKYRMR